MHNSMYSNLYSLEDSVILDTNRIIYQVKATTVILKEVTAKILTTVALTRITIFLMQTKEFITERSGAATRIIGLTKKKKALSLFYHKKYFW